MLQLRNGEPEIHHLILAYLSVSGLLFQSFRVLSLELRLVLLVFF